MFGPLKSCFRIISNCRRQLNVIKSERLSISGVCSIAALMSKAHFLSVGDNSMRLSSSRGLPAGVLPMICHVFSLCYALRLCGSSAPNCCSSCAFISLVVQYVWFAIRLVQAVKTRVKVSRRLLDLLPFWKLVFKFRQCQGYCFCRQPPHAPAPPFLIGTCLRQTRSQISVPLCVAIVSQWTNLFEVLYVVERVSTC